MSFRTAMLRLGKHHAEQTVRLSVALRGAPREEVVVALDDLHREQRRMRSEILLRYKNITKARRRKMMRIYKESLRQRLTFARSDSEFHTSGKIVGGKRDGRK